MFNTLEKAPRIAAPEGKTHSYTSEVRALTSERAIQAQVRFNLMQENFSAFYDTTQQGEILNTLLSLTSKKSFMGPTLERVAKEAAWRNQMVEFMHGEHTSYASQVHNLTWATIFIDYFTRTPIPENIEAIRNAEVSLEPMAALAAADKGFYNKMREGVQVMNIDGDKLKLGDLEMQVLANGVASEARMMHDAGETIEVEGQTYYNGLPHDRKLYPTLLLPVGSPIALKITNNSDKAYAVIPTINGIPFKIDELSLQYCDLEASAFPLQSVKPQTEYIKPHETSTFDKFFVNKTGITTNRNNSYSFMLGELSNSELSELSFLYAPILNKTLTEDERALIGKLGNQHLIDATMYETRYAHVREFITQLGKSKQTDIQLVKPLMADRISSSKLGNPFLGSLGLAVIELTRPPVKAEHRYGFVDRGNNLMFGGGGLTRSIGHAGLAQIGGGRDQIASATSFGSTLAWDSYIHKFVGYAPLNLMSLEK